MQSLQLRALRLRLQLHARHVQLQRLAGPQNASRTAPLRTHRTGHFFF